MSAPDPDAPQPTTSLGDMESGIFNMVVSFVRLYQQQGLNFPEACERVAVFLERLSSGLRQW